MDIRNASRRAKHNRAGSVGYTLYTRTYTHTHTHTHTHTQTHRLHTLCAVMAYIKAHLCLQHSPSFSDATLLFIGPRSYIGREREKKICKGSKKKKYMLIISPRDSERSCEPSALWAVDRSGPLSAWACVFAAHHGGQTVPALIGPRAFMIDESESERRVCISGVSFYQKTEIVPEVSQPHLSEG